MKKFIVTTLILTLALFVFPLSSFAKKDNDKGNGAFVCYNDEEIEGLIFDFDPPLDPEDLPGLPIDDPIASVVVIVGDGSEEMATITPSQRFNYHATLLDGRINAFDEDGNQVLVLRFESATLNEHYLIEGHIPPEDDCEDFLLYPAPENNADVNLFFKIQNAKVCFVVDVHENGDDVLWCDDTTFDLMLKLNHFVKFKL